jgi:hypothetical protein
VDALDEGVDVLGDGTDLVFTLDLDATGEIAVAAGEIGNRSPRVFSGAREPLMAT